MMRREDLGGLVGGERKSLRSGRGWKKDVFIDEVWRSD